jgi:hypothetical protein
LKNRLGFIAKLSKGIVGIEMEAIFTSAAVSGNALSDVMAAKTFST